MVNRLCLVRWFVFRLTFHMLNILLWPWWKFMFFTLMVDRFTGGKTWSCLIRTRVIIIKTQREFNKIKFTCIILSLCWPNGCDHMWIRLGYIGCWLCFEWRNLDGSWHTWISISSGCAIRFDCNEMDLLIRRLIIIQKCLQTLYLSILILEINSSLLQPLIQFLLQRFFLCLIFWDDTDVTHISHITLSIWTLLWDTGIRCVLWCMVILFECGVVLIKLGFPLSVGIWFVLVVFWELDIFLELCLSLVIHDVVPLGCRFVRDLNFTTFLLENSDLLTQSSSVGSLFMDLLIGSVSYDDLVLINFKCASLRCLISVRLAE